MAYPFIEAIPSNFPEGSLSSSQRIIAVSTAHHRHPGGQQEARKASLARLRRFAVRRSPYWRRSIFLPIGDRACEAWVRIAPNSCARCPTTEPPHPRMSRAHEQLKYRSNSRSRTLVPVASIVPCLRPTVPSTRSRSSRQRFQHFLSLLSLITIVQWTDKNCTDNETNYCNRI